MHEEPEFDVFGRLNGALTDSNDIKTSDQFLYCNDRLSGFILAWTEIQ